MCIVLGKCVVYVCRGVCGVELCGVCGVELCGVCVVGLCGVCVYWCVWSGVGLSASLFVP